MRRTVLICTGLSAMMTRRRSASKFQGSRVTSDGGLLLVRELDERLGFSDLIAQHIADSRGKNTQFPLADLVRQSIYRRLAGYEDVNDAERLSHDPAFRLIGSEQLWERGGCVALSSSRMGKTCPFPTVPVLHDDFHEVPDTPPQWVKPSMVVEVEYRQRLKDGLRHAALKGLRPDKKPGLIRRSPMSERGPF